MKALRPREEKLISFIRAQVKNHGVAPSLDEMAAFCGVKSKSHAHRMVDELVWAGYLKRFPNRARGLELVQTKDNHLPDCECARCGELRYLAQLQLVKAIHVAPEIGPGVRLVGLRSPTVQERASLLGVKLFKAAPRTRTAIPLGGGR